MAKLNFSMRGFIYESGLDCLRDSFTAAVEGIQVKLREESEAWDSETGDYGIETQFAENGSVVFDPGDVYSYKVEALEDAHVELRKAFAIAIYHFWERKMRTYGKLEKGNHKIFTEVAESLGIMIPSEFARVYRLANALKHNSAGTLNKLHDEWSEVSGVLFKVEGTRDWYSRINLTDDHIYYLLDLTKQAGPSVKKRNIKVETEVDAEVPGAV